MYDENIAVENFIDFCDNMMIAEESAIGDIKKIAKPMKRQLEDLKIKIRESDGKPKEQIRYYKEALNIITKVENQVNSINVSKFEENTRLAGIFIAVLLPLSLEIAHQVKSGTGNDKPDAKFISRLIAEVGLSTTAAIKGSVDITSKKDTLKFINDEKRNINMIIRYLESVSSPANEGFIDTIKKRMNDKKERKRKVKDANNYQNDLLQKSRDASFNNAIPHIKKIVAEVHSKCTYAAKSNRLDVDISKVYFENNNVEAHAYFSFDVNSNYSTSIDIIHKTINDILNKYKDTLHEYDIQDYIDEGFDLYVTK